MYSNTAAVFCISVSCTVGRLFVSVFPTTRCTSEGDFWAHTMCQTLCSSVEVLSELGRHTTTKPQCPKPRIAAVLESEHWEPRSRTSNCTNSIELQNFPVAHVVKILPVMGSIPGSGRSSGEGNGNPLQYSCLENSMDREAWRVTVMRS